MNSNIKRNDLSKTINELNYLLSPLYNIDYRKLANIKNTISKLEIIAQELDNRNDVSHSVGYTDVESISEENLFGVLPKILVSKNFFPSNKELINFSTNILNINLSNNVKKTRSHIIGHIISALLGIQTLDYNIRLNKIKQYLMNVNIKEYDFFVEWDRILKKNNK